jgi:hypothetical protein
MTKYRNYNEVTISFSGQIVLTPPLSVLCIAAEGGFTHNALKRYMPAEINR